MTPQTLGTRPTGTASCDVALPASPAGSESFKQFKVSGAPAERWLEAKPPDRSIADFYRHHGYKSLLHRCIHWKNAVSILKTGNLAPFGSYQDQLPGFAGHADPTFVYFRATRLEQSPDSIQCHSCRWGSDGRENGKEWGDLNQITFIHDLAVLDCQPFYTGSRYGEPTADTFSTVFFRPFANPLTTKVTHREILVQGKVSNRSLMAIWVHHSRRDEFLTRFKQAGVDTVDGLPLAEFVNPEKPLPSRLDPNDKSPALNPILALAFKKALASFSTKTGRCLPVSGDQPGGSGPAEQNDT